MITSVLAFLALVAPFATAEGVGVTAIIATRGVVARQRRCGRTSGGAEESSAGGNLQCIAAAHHLEKQGGASSCERRDWCLHGEDNGDVAEVFIETRQCVEDKPAIEDGLTNVTERIHEHLLALAVGGDREITID